MKPKQFFYILAFVGLALVLGGGFFYYHAAGRVRQSTKKLSQTLAEIQVAAEKGTQLARLSGEYEAEIKQLLPQIESALPNDKRQSELTRQLQNAAGAAGVRLGSLAFSPSTVPSATSQTEKASSLLAMPLTFTAEGSYPAIQTFLQRLENFPRQADVKSVTLTQGAGGRIGAQFKVNFFIKP